MHTLSIGRVTSLRLGPPEVYPVGDTGGAVHSRRLIVQSETGEVQIDFMGHTASAVRLADATAPDPEAADVGKEPDPSHEATARPDRLSIEEEIRRAAMPDPEEPSTDDLTPHVRRFEPAAMPPLEVAPWQGVS